ncbi:hypothetical protein FDECE_11005 [Fusarium decemcellulare]|nr:hypothetical protein FDECE_11005 [Fusarium decemcellulare]
MPPRRSASRAARPPVEDDGASNTDIGKGRAVSSVTKWYNDYSANLDRDADWRREHLQRPSAEYSRDPNYIHPLVPQAPSDNWSTSDEQDVQQQWIDQKDLYAIPSSLMNDYKLSWKLCIRFAECTPLDIIGVGTRLVFGKSGVLGNDNRMWSAHFTRQFNCLITHPAWTDPPFSAAGYLTAALQYAVILKSNNRSKWELAPVNPFAREFLVAIHSSAAPYDYRKLHKQARKRCRNNMTALSTLSNIFKSLEETIQTPRELKQTDMALYEINTEHIGLLTKALDQMHDTRTGHSLLSTEVFYKMAITPKPSDEPPKLDAQVTRWHELTMLDQFRQIKIRERNGQVSNNFAPAGEASGSGPGSGVDPQLTASGIDESGLEASSHFAPADEASGVGAGGIDDTPEDDLYSATPVSFAPVFDEEESYIPPQSDAGSPMDVEKEATQAHAWVSFEAHTSGAPDAPNTWTPRPFVISMAEPTFQDDVEQLRTMEARVAGLILK